MLSFSVILMLAIDVVARRHADTVAAVVVDALDDTAQAFYEKYGFRALNRAGHLYLTMKKIKMLP